MQKEKLVPAIRFKGFDENFRIIKLNEIAEYRNGKGHENFVLEKGKYILVNSKFISSNGSQCKYTNINISPLLKNDIVMVLSDIPGGKALAKTFLIDNDDKYALNQRICALTSKSTSPIYLNIILNRNSQLLALDDHVNQTNINRQQVMNLQLLIPSYVEQEKIGKLFSSLDLIIKSQKSKLEKLQTIKQSLLSKMFASDNQKMPDIRFKDFLDAWNHKLVKSLGYITTGNSNTQDSDVNGVYPFFIRSDKPLKSNKYLYDEEAVITIGDGNIGKVFHYINGKFDLHQRCYKISNFTDVLGKYFYWYFSSNFYDRVIRMSAKATVDSVRLEMIADMEIYFPSNKNEQSKISIFLDSLDSLIQFQDQKLEKLNNIKQALLEKMFY
ncbi:restriction endonuclease subunit S [Mycoplasma sp. Z707]|uniref:restriction endonuclease subunit S n=1 Tax=Mycoplasma sp. Z707 TaxID=3401691 RepID=UPI003AAFCDF8